MTKKLCFVILTSLSSWRHWRNHSGQIVSETADNVLILYREKSWSNRQNMKSKSWMVNFKVKVLEIKFELIKVVQWMSVTRTSLDFWQLSCVPFPDSPIFGHFFCLKLGPKSWNTSLGHLILNFYDPKFPKWPSLDCLDFGQLGCPNFKHKSCKLMSEIGTLKCHDFRQSLSIYIFSI